MNAVKVAAKLAVFKKIIPVRNRFSAWSAQLASTYVLVNVSRKVSAVKVVLLSTEPPMDLLVCHAIRIASLVRTLGLRGVVRSSTM